VLPGGVAAHESSGPRQALAYHLFTDRRDFLGMPNFGHVASNLSFAVIGIWGLMFVLRSNSNQVAGRFPDQRERWPYLFFFVGLLLTAFGSSYYDLSPNNSWPPMGKTTLENIAVHSIVSQRERASSGVESQ